MSLPVVDAGARRAPRMGSTRAGRWRFVVLLAVNLLMAAHIVQWLIVGSTLSPVEPSESMQTLENGVINAGAVLFALALLSTLVFGRFFCGWLCHVVALQDACAWLMNRAGVRPKPFRSRLLVFVPLVLGLYMFVWPNFKRLALAPALHAAGMDWPTWLKPVAPINMWRTEMIVPDFWATFAAWYVAVPFLLVCGFATVYFLGAKGFCTYACPYGGLFAPIEKASPVRIRVTDACMHCGHCTSVCTSNVRVSDEVRDFGMVVDPGCMKCMDCVSACPSDALYLGLGAPALGKRVRDKAHRAESKKKAGRRYDLTWPEEIAGAALFLLSFLAFRGMLDQVPMLLAGGLAAIVTFLFLTAWWVLVRPHARVYGVVLKQKGRVRLAGVGFVLATLLVAGVVAWGGQARYFRWRADVAYAGATIPAGFVVRPEFAPGASARAEAERAAAWLAQADSFERGGTGWTLNAEHRTREAYFLAITGRLKEAADALAVVVEHGQPGDGLVDQLVSLRRAAGASEDEQRAIYEHALSLHPDLNGARTKLAMNTAGHEDPYAGAKWFEVDAPELRDSIGFRFHEVSYWVQMGLHEEAGRLLPRVIEMAEADEHNRAGWLADCADVAMKIGDQALAERLIGEAMATKGAHPGVFFAGAEVAAIYGDGATAEARIDEGLAMKGGDSVASLNRAGMLLLRLRDPEKGTEVYKRAVAASEQPFERARLGATMAIAGVGLSHKPLLDAGLAAMTAAAEESGEPTIWHDLSLERFRAGRYGEACDAIIRAAELAPGSVELAGRAADMCEQTGDGERAASWRAEAQRRLGSAKGSAASAPDAGAGG